MKGDKEINGNGEREGWERKKRREKRKRKV